MLVVAGPGSKEVAQLVVATTEPFGPLETDRDRALQGAVSYRWQVQSGSDILLQEPVEPGRGDAFSLLFVRSYGAPTALPTPAEAEQ